MKVWRDQFWHIVWLTLLLIGVSILSKTSDFFKGDLWSINTKNWFLLAILVPILHQIYVLICWRTQLYYKSISNLFGEKGFKLYKAIFTILILLRPVSISLLAVSNTFTFQLNPFFSYGFSAALFIPVVYLAYSLRKYFGFNRAFGIDHFYPEIYENKPFVNEGIFKYTNNAMYVFGFFLLWIPGILLQSKAALLAALFSHCYIWVHYYFTELPDMKEIYGGT